MNKQGLNWEAPHYLTANPKWFYGLLKELYLKTNRKEKERKKFKFNDSETHTQK